MKHLSTAFFGVLSVMLLSVACTAQTPQVTLTTFATGLDRPIGIEHCGDNRLFIVEQDGVIKVCDLDGNVNSTPFLDITTKVNSQFNEQGLLGLAFHPNYKQNGYFFVYYTYGSGDSRLARYSVSDDANVADANSEVVLVEESQPYWNHNGGQLAFGPDGYLYWGLGDGGSGNDPENNGQDTQALLGKILRLDVDQGDAVAIPADNPFVGDPTTLDEIWAVGMRNPWRFSFDRKTGDLWIADVGQNAWEEIDFEAAGSGGGLNYGWRCREGLHTGVSSGCGPSTDYVDPIFEYEWDPSSVTGGFVYRGGLNVDMAGWYFCADYVSGEWYAIAPDGSGGWDTETLTQSAGALSTFGEDMYGEMYCARLGGNNRIYKLEGADQSGINVSSVITDASVSNPNGGSVDLTVTGGTAPYTFDWSNGNSIEDLLNAAGGTYWVTVTDADGNEAIVNATIAGPPVSVGDRVPVPFNFTVFPNPATEKVTVELFGSSDLEYLTLIDAFGRIVERIAIENRDRIEIATSHLAAGSYFLIANEMSAAGRTVNKRFVVVE